MYLLLSNTVNLFTIYDEVKVTQLCPTLCNPMDYTVPGILQARILELGSCSLLQGIFPTQGLNPGLLHCRLILYQLSHKRRRTQISFSSHIRGITHTYLPLTVQLISSQIFLSSLTVMEPAAFFLFLCILAVIAGNPLIGQC